MRHLLLAAAVFALSSCKLTDRQRDEAHDIAAAVVEGQLYDGDTITRLRSRIGSLEERVALLEARLR